MSNPANIAHFSVKFLRPREDAEKKVVLLSDLPMEPEQEKICENFSKIADQVVIIAPVNDEIDLLKDDSWAKDDKIIPEIQPGDSIVAMGRIAPTIVNNYERFNTSAGIVFINPVFISEIAPKMSSLETPCLVVTSTPGNLDHNPDAVKYHDLIAGSRIQYVRGCTGNPLYLRFTQSFNAIQRFLANE